MIKGNLGKPNDNLLLMRKLTVSLQEEDWKRLVEVHPEPIEWILKQIKNAIREKPPVS